MRLEDAISNLIKYKNELPLAPELQLEEKVGRLFAEMLKCNELRRDTIIILNLKGKISKEPIDGIIDRALAACMRNTTEAHDMQVKEYLGLIEWESYAEAKNHYGENNGGRKNLSLASARIVKCFKERLPTLDLSRLGLNSLPQSIFKHCTHISTLNCFGNKLIEIPHEISNLASLQILDCKNNCLKEIPAELLQCEHLTHLFCEGNLITSLPGDFEKRFSLTSQNHKILEQFKLKAETNEFADLTLEKFCDDVLYFNNICLWLQALLFEKEFQKDHYSKYYSNLTLSLLEFAGKNKEFQNILRGSLDLGFGTCEDRAAMMFNNLQFYMRLIENGSDSIESYLQLLKGSYALNSLEKIARELVKEYDNEKEELEIFLALQIRLKDALNLPLPKKDMAYFIHSKLWTRDIKNAEFRVKGELRDLKSLSNFLMNDKIWIEKLKATYRKEYEKERSLEKIRDKMASLDQIDLAGEKCRSKINNIVYFVQNQILTCSEEFQNNQAETFEKLEVFRKEKLKYIKEEEYHLIADLLKDTLAAKEKEWIGKKTKELLEPPKKRLQAPSTNYRPKKKPFYKIH